MPFGTKGVSLAVLIAAVLTTAGCGGSGKSAVPAPSTNAKDSPQIPSAPSTPSAASSGGGPGSPLTADQIAKALLTGADEAGYAFDASQDSKATTDHEDRVAAGGATCQQFIDAQEALSPKYGTAAEVDRELTKPGDAHLIEDSVMVFRSADQASAVITDLTAGLKGCQNLSVPQPGGGTVTMAPSAIPELTKDGQAGFIDYLTAGGKTELMAAELVHVGSTVSVVAIVGPVSTDPAVLKQMGGTQLVHLSDVQVGRLKAAQGLG